MLALVTLRAQVPTAPTNVTVNAQLGVPSIIGLSSSSGPVGTTVIIHGANFGQIQGVSTVTFNGTAATVTVWSIDTLTTTVPSGATTGNVVVHVATLTSNGSAFTVTPPDPAVVTITAPTSSSTYDAGTSSTLTTLAGTATTAPAAPITSCTWSNNLGGSGTATGTTSWSVASIALTVGTNVITVVCANGAPSPGSDVIAVTRSSGGGSANPISVVRMPSTSATLPDSIWTGAGVLGGIPSATWPTCNNTNCNNLAGAGAVTSATVNAAISGAQVGGVACASLATACVVPIRAGAFTLATGVNLSTSFVALRGAGPSNTGTRLTVSANSGTSCGYAYQSAVVICSGGGYATTDTTWTSGYTKGDTTIGLGTRTGLVAGRSMVHLAQLNDDGYPTTSGIYMSDSGPPISGTAGDCGSPGSAGISGSCVSQQSLVTACSGSCTGAGTITIDPPLSGPSMRSGRTNTAHFGANALQWVGLEEVSVDWSSAAANTTYGIQINNATNIWVKHVRMVNTGSAAYGIQMIRAARLSFVDNYIYRVNNTSQENYGMVLQGVGSLLIQNNIFQGHGNAIITDNGFNNSVIGYNFWVGDGGVSYGKHLGGESMVLLEGNIARTLWADNIDAVACCHIAFRNALLGNRYSASSIGNVHSAFSLAAKNRMWSLVGNVISDAALYGSSYTCTDNTCVYDFGGDIGLAGAPFDALVGGTMLRWFNWDHVTSTADTTNNDQTGTRCVAGDVPSAIAFMPNALPGSCAAPSSLYLAAKPSWFGVLTYPGIGPDVSGGSVTSAGGHIYLNPAANCYLTTMGGATDGSGSASNFTC